MSSSVEPYVLRAILDQNLSGILMGPDKQPVYDCELAGKSGATSIIKRRAGYGNNAIDSKSLADGGEEESVTVATIDFKWFHSDILHMRGKEQPVKEWLPKTKLHSISRKLYCEKNDKHYRWKAEVNPKLRDADDRIVASCGDDYLKIFSAGPRPNILAISYPEANDWDIIDDIVVSWFIVNRDRRIATVSAEAAAGVYTST